MMGYHGFGMRKEVYKRKPKKAFEKIKNHNKKNPYGAPKTRDDREVYIHTYHKPAYKRWWFILPSLCFVGYFAYVVIVGNLLPKYKLKKQIEAFENSGLLNLYQSNKGEIEKTFNLMEESADGWVSLNNYYYNDPQTIIVQSRRIYPTNARKQIFYDQAENFMVSNDLLLYSSERHRLRAKTWQIKVVADSLQTIPFTYLMHIDVDTMAMKQVLKDNLTRKWRYDVYPTYRKLTFAKFDHDYRLFFASRPEKVLETHPNNLTELAPGVYWR